MRNSLLLLTSVTCLLPGIAAAGHGTFARNCSPVPARDRAPGL